MVQVITVFFSLCLFWQTAPQQDVLKDIGNALRTGSSKELVKFLNNNVEIKIDGKTSNYSITQAEVVLKDFFLNNPPRGFNYVHQGASTKEGLQYTIGSFELDKGSYRVVMLLKKVKDQLKIDSISFTKE